MKKLFKGVKENKKNASPQTKYYQSSLIDIFGNSIISLSSICCIEIEMKGKEKLEIKEMLNSSMKEKL